MTSAIDLKRYRTRAMAWDGASNRHVRLFWKFFHFVNQFPQPARKNGHPVLFVILEQDFCDKLITISSPLK
jgi:hypothetical protein